MLYAKLAKFKLYAFEDRLNNTETKLQLVPCKNDLANVFMIHYYKKLRKNGNPDTKSYWHERDLERNDPILVKVVEKLGKKANGTYADLEVVEVPDDVSWYVEEYDGIEWISENHRTWG